MDEGTANATLVNANLKAQITYVTDEKSENGKVVSQSIESGEEVDVDTTIEIKVNKIEKEQKTVQLYLDVVPQVYKSANTNTNTADTPEENSDSVTITVIVNGKTLISGKVSKVGKENEDLGKITGTGKQKIEVNLTQNGQKKTLTDEINIDEFDNNANHYIKNK